MKPGTMRISKLPSGQASYACGVCGQSNEQLPGTEFYRVNTQRSRGFMHSAIYDADCLWSLCLGIRKMLEQQPSDRPVEVRAVHVKTSEKE